MKEDEFNINSFKISVILAHNIIYKCSLITIQKKDKSSLITSSVHLYLFSTYYLKINFYFYLYNLRCQNKRQEFLFYPQYFTYKYKQLSRKEVISLPLKKKHKVEKDVFLLQ